MPASFSGMFISIKMNLLELQSQSNSELHTLQLIPRPYLPNTRPLPRLYPANTALISDQYSSYTRFFPRQGYGKICWACLCVFVELQAHTLSSARAIAMAASLSALLSSPCASSFSSQRVSAAASTSYGAQVGVTWRRRSKFSVGARAQQQEGGGGSERDEVSELEKALGVENRTVRNVSADKGGPQRRYDTTWFWLSYFIFIFCFSLLSLVWFKLWSWAKKIFEIDECVQNL